MLLYTWDAFHVEKHWKSEVEDAPTLDALLATVLAALVKRRLRIGLGREYSTFAAELPGVRGRIDFNESLKRLSFQHGRAYCAFQQFSSDVPKNQIVRSTLTRLVQIGDFGPDHGRAVELRTRLRHLARELDAISLIELSAELVRRTQMCRHDADYRLMLSICLTIVQRQMPTEFPGGRQHSLLDRDSFTLHNIYERFVARFYQRWLRDWTVSPQQRLLWPAEEHSAHLPSMYADLVLEHKFTGHLIILDTKFTARLLVTGRWGGQTFDRSHLFQLFAYLRSQEHRSEKHRSATGVLLFPAVGDGLSEKVRVQGHEMRWETVDLARPWQLIEQSLLDIPARVVSSQESTRPS
jgi:5-methylcytosine-specific restriction enzyme subunit McrC